jgi:hypothetical protein
LQQGRQVPVFSGADATQTGLCSTAELMYVNIRQQNSHKPTTQRIATGFPSREQYDGEKRAWKIWGVNYPGDDVGNGTTVTGRGTRDRYDP